jgi:hypothetical protein
MQFNSANDELGKMSQPRRNKFQTLTSVDFSKYATTVVIVRAAVVSKVLCLWSLFSLLLHNILSCMSVMLQQTNK